MSTPETGPRIYRGLNRRERAGWILGVTAPQALTCVVLALPVLMALSQGRFRAALVLLVVCGSAATLVVTPVRGRPAVRWLIHLLLHQLGARTGWSRWQSAASAGQAVRHGEPDLPGVLTRVAMPDGPPFRHHGRICLLHDTGEGRWGATARLTHTGVGMLTDEHRARLAARLGNLLVGIGHRELVDRISLYVRTVPDDGTEYDLWRARHHTPDAPPLAVAATDELTVTVGKVSVQHEIFVTVSGPETALRKPATTAGGGVEGRAHVLYRALDGLEEPLKALGVDSVRWLDGHGVAHALRTGFNPASQAVLTAENLRGEHAGALPLAAAGPTTAPSPSARSYTHDGFTSVTYSVLMPEAGTVFGSLGPLLAVRTPGERRALAIHYEVLDAARSSRAVRAQRHRSGIVADLKRSRGFTTTATDRRDHTGAQAQEHAVAGGHALVRYAVVASVTVPSHWNVEDHAARLETDVAGRFPLLRLELAQDTAFVAACLPVGVGLPRIRGGLR
ncbi:hypothetical protein F0L68_35620 [Solihabitans fulvus]|uniref:Type VII secretion protein EccE n=1 Tax=Solihabitans fulvus TaxID=1892852 RepID=A0A5B2WKP0_9PSEU|nr:SCO6880 family protein [Solihabitans fulvus]KAA2252381.1 hypothetical protein F0L68_35620 [Solihabitans fulvus]